MESASPVEDKIINAAIECIEKYGIQGTTNRKIAEIAGVNSAAINYYFRSKDALIQRCMQVTLQNAFDFEAYEKLPGGSARERCVAIFNELIEGGIRFPGITRAHFYDLLAEGKYDSLVVEKLNEFVHRLAGDLQTRGAGLEPQQLEMACVQITAASMMMILAPRLFKSQLGIDLNDAQTREEFVSRLVNRLL
jgi:AcrR family transcriptional regulator